MSYNRSALRAGYSVGDPFLGGLIKGIGKGIGSIAKIGGGLLPGPAGALLGGIGGILAPTRSSPAPAGTPGSMLDRFRPVTGMVNVSLPGMGIGGGVSLPARGGAAGPPAVAGGGIPKGYRLNKTGYFLRSGQYVAPGTKYVKIRRTNAGNAKALRRSLRRTESFVGLVKRTRKATRSVKSL